MISIWIDDLDILVERKYPFELLLEKTNFASIEF